MVRLDFSEDEVTNLSPEAKAAVLAIVKKSRYGRSTLRRAWRNDRASRLSRWVLWGGSSFDPKLNRVFVNSDESLNRLKLTPAPAGKPYRYTLATAAGSLTRRAIRRSSRRGVYVGDRSGKRFVRLAGS